MEITMNIVWIEEDRHYAVVNDDGSVVTRCIDERQAIKIVEAIEKDVYKESNEE
jgi:hypothetical protein